MNPSFLGLHYSHGHRYAPPPHVEHETPSQVTRTQACEPLNCPFQKQYSDTAAYVLGHAAAPGSHKARLNSPSTAEKANNSVVGDR